ncbi:MAG: S41 family peptidase [Candidatus Izemoplasmatales bacterium]|nr:S41 family peptidase [Candidatus Izemoplasmatales bacterium]
MKKLFSLLIVFLFVAGFAGCSVKTTLPPTTVAPTTEAPTTEAPTTVDSNPVFIGIIDKEIEEGDEINLLDGISVVDAEDGIITNQIIIEENNFNKDIPGEYTIILTVTDSGLNIVTESFIVIVTEHVLTSQELALLDIDRINLDSNNLVLPRLGENNTKFYWSSNNTRVVTNNGFVFRPPVGSDSVTVTLTLTAVNLDYETTQDFDLIIEPYSEVSVTEKIQLPFEGTSEEYVVQSDSEVDIFYVDNGTVPYIDVETFITLLDGAIDTSLINYSYPKEDVLRIDYSVEYLDFDGVTLITESYYAEIDFSANTFKVSNYDFFSGYIASTESDYGEGLNYVGADYVDGQEVVIPLGFYNFDLVVYNDGVEDYYLMPLHVANRLFAGDIYYDVYYNGDKLWGIDTFVIASGDDPLNLVDLVRTSSLNLEVAETDLKLATFNFFAFTMDYFYGLKPDKGYETYYDEIYELAELMVMGSDRNMYTMIFDLAYQLNDLHSWHQFSGYYEKPAYTDSLTPTRDDLGVSVLKFYSILDSIEAELIEKYGIADYPNEYTLLDNDKVAVIHLTEFTIDTPLQFKTILDSLPVSVEDVVIDLAYNTGGNIGAVMRIFGYMTEQQFMYHSQNPADGSAVTYYIESDYVAYNYNWYVLTSGVTFSAANMFASMAKELGIPIIGQKSSGGASSIGLVILPDGSGIFISTNNVLSTRIGNEIDGYTYESVEYGIDVDYLMEKVTDDTELLSTINEIRSE